jgi:hypothetical protein
LYNNEEKKYIKVIDRIMPAAMVLMLLVSMSYFLAGQFILPNDRGVSSDNATSLDIFFDVVWENGDTENITLPTTYEPNKDEELVLETVIPDNISGDWLMIWNMGHEIDVYVDDELRMSINNEGRRLFKGDVVYQYDFIPLHESDRARTVSIHFPEYMNENHQLGSVYIGDKASLLLKAIRPYQFSLFLALTVMCMGIMTIVKARFLTKVENRSYDLFYMSLGVTVASAWFLFNSPAAQFLFPNIETAKDCAFFFASMIPLPFLLYISRLFRGRYALVFTILKGISVLSFLVLVIGYLLCGGSLNILFIPTEISALASLGICFALITGDIQTGRVKEYFIAAAGIVGFIAFALLYVILFALYPYRGDSGSILIAGIICIYSTSVISYRKSLTD